MLWLMRQLVNFLCNFRATNSPGNFLFPFFRVHVRVRPGHKFFRLFKGRVISRVADAQFQFIRRTVPGLAGSQSRFNIRAQLPDSFLLLRFTKQDKFIAAKTGNETVVRTAHLLQNFSHLFQGLVPFYVPILIVNLFKLINIQHQQIKRLRRIVKFQFVMQDPLKLVAIIQPGQRIQGYLLLLQIEIEK